MFTVIICDRHIIEDCYHKYHIYLKPLLDREDIAFCPWNTEGKTLEEALPQLAALIRSKAEWRAIVVNDSSTWGFDGVNKKNPYNYIDAGKKSYAFSDFEQIRAFRAAEAESCERAMSNPLMALAAWLCGLPSSMPPDLCYEEEKAAVETADDAETYSRLLEKLELKASEVEQDRSRSLRYEMLTARFEPGGELFNPPRAVIAIAERAKNMDAERARLAWSSHTEFDYSQFYTDNLYPEKLRYLLFDLPYIKKRRNENQYFNFLTTVLLLAAYDTPNGALRSNRVYNIRMEVDSRCVRELCGRYNARLLATLSRIDGISELLREKERQPVDRYTAEDVFESGVTIPVEVVKQESRSNLRAHSDKIGLSTDCPGDEYEYWDKQFRTINKYFIRFLREPRRAVKTAARGTFRAMNRIKDDRALQLNEYQREDVLYALEEEERGMQSAAAPRLFNTEQYSKKMREADKGIRDGIGQRMTRKKTVIVGLVGMGAYALGLLPLLLSNRNTADTLLFSLLLAAGVLGLLAAVYLVYLFVQRHKLLEKFRQFNAVMTGILQEIDSGMGAFSDYLSHACNVMREFSVLNYSENQFRRKQHILRNHKRIISRRIEEVNSFFADYTAAGDGGYFGEAAAYDFDFTVMAEYEYDIPYSPEQKEIDFLQAGNRIRIPTDYVNTVTLTREELYD